MRKLLVVLLVLSAVWSGYWFAGSTALKSAADQWFADQAAHGIIAQKTALTVAGFPNRFDLTVEGVKLADPQTGYGWEAPFAQILAMTWKPWHIIAALPPTQTLRLPDQDIGLTSTRLMASLRARPSLSVPLEEIVLDGTALNATSTKGWSTGLATLIFAIRADHSQPAAYDIALTATSITPDPAFLKALPPASDLPPEIALVSASLSARLSAPMDRNAAQTKPSLTALDVRDARATWGPLALSAQGQIAPDTEGYAAGRITIQITNWQRLIPLLVAAGAVTPQVAPTVENMLKAMAQQGGKPDVLTLPLILEKGRMSLGPLPLGPAPLMVPPTN